MKNIETDRLVISELSESDAPFILELLNSEGWLQYIGDRGVRNLDDAERYIVNGPMASYKEHGFGLWLVSQKEGGRRAGICGLIQRGYLPMPDIGFAFMPQYEGKGIAREAAEAVVKYAQTLSVPLLAAITTPDNERSLKLLYKLGFSNKGMIQPDGDSELMLLEKELNNGK